MWLKGLLGCWFTVPLHWEMAGTEQPLCSQFIVRSPLDSIGSDDGHARGPHIYDCNSLGLHQMQRLLQEGGYTVDTTNQSLFNVMEKSSWGETNQTACDVIKWLHFLTSSCTLFERNLFLFFWMDQRQQKKGRKKKCCICYLHLLTVII